MKFATCALLVGLLALAPVAATAGVPEGKVAVVTVTSVDGLAKADGKVTESRTSLFSFDGTDYTIDRSALASIEGVETLVLINHRKDTAAGDGVTRAYSQQVRALGTSNFTVEDLPGKVLSYQVATVGGNLRLLGDGDQIVCSAGDKGPFRIWKIESVKLVDRASIRMR